MLRLSDDSGDEELNRELQRIVGRHSSLELVIVERPNFYRLYLAYDIRSTITDGHDDMHRTSLEPIDHKDRQDVTLTQDSIAQISKIEEEDFREWRRFSRLSGLPYYPPKPILEMEVCPREYCTIAACGHNDNNDDD